MSSPEHTVNRLSVRYSLIAFKKKKTKKKQGKKAGKWKKKKKLASLEQPLQHQPTPSSAYCMPTTQPISPPSSFAVSCSTARLLSCWSHGAVLIVIVFHYQQRLIALQPCVITGCQRMAALVRRWTTCFALLHSSPLPSSLSNLVPLPPSPFPWFYSRLCMHPLFACVFVWHSDLILIFSPLRQPPTSPPTWQRPTICVCSARKTWWDKISGCIHCAGWFLSKLTF